MAYRVHVQQPDDWRAAREIRLAMLADEPMAFLERHEDALAKPDADWQQRERRLPHTYKVALVEPGNPVWLGMMRCKLEPDPTPSYWITSVWLHPDHRGHGGAELMLAEIERWALCEGADALWLEVNETMHRAHRFYERLGFEDTGQRRPYPLGGDTEEIEMVKPLVQPGEPRRRSTEPGQRSTDERGA